MSQTLWSSVLIPTGKMTLLLGESKYLRGKKINKNAQHGMKNWDVISKCQFYSLNWAPLVFLISPKMAAFPHQISQRPPSPPPALILPHLHPHFLMFFWKRRSVFHQQGQGPIACHSRVWDKSQATLCPLPSCCKSFLPSCRVELQHSVVAVRLYLMHWPGGTHWQKEMGFDVWLWLDKHSVFTFKTE